MAEDERVKRKYVRKKKLKRKRKKKKKVVEKKSLKRPYNIILANHGKMLRTICTERTEEAIYKRFNALLEESSKVDFPIRYNNHKHVMIDAEYEIVILKRREDGDEVQTMVRDDSGEYVPYEASTDKWMIVDRARYNLQETFFVYGYHPKLQRKTFTWIFENFIENGAKDKTKFKSLRIYLNKVLFECNGEVNMVICKNASDAALMFNKIEELCAKKKYKYIFFFGDTNKSKYKADAIEMIRKLTNWNMVKIHRPSTRP